MTEPDTPLSEMVCPVPDCGAGWEGRPWVSRPFDDRVLSQRSKARNMWGEHYRTEHLPIPTVRPYQGDDTPHV